MAAMVVLDEQLEIPLEIGALSEFRKWATSDEFPERGRIDFISGRIEVDMSPEDLFCHGTLKVEMVRVLSQHVKEAELGHLFSDRTRMSCPDADLSSEPDIVFVTHAAVDQGQVRLVPKGTGESDRYIELEGAPDLIVEIVSDSSVRKDTQRLPEAYFAAGIREFWLADARGKELIFKIHKRGKSGFDAAESAEDGFQWSEAFGCSFRLVRSRSARGHWVFDLLVHR